MCFVLYITEKLYYSELVNSHCHRIIFMLIRRRKTVSLSIENNTSILHLIAYFWQ